MLTQCQKIIAQIHLYLDDELQGGERDDVESHLADCPGCRTAFARESNFHQAIRDCRTLYVSSPELRERVHAILNDAPAPHLASTRLRGRIERALEPAGARRFLAAAVIVAMIVGVWCASAFRKTARQDERSAFASMAVDHHHRHLRGQLPLEIRSHSAHEISQWFVGKVPFPIELPHYEKGSGLKQMYSIEGARLLTYEKDYAAYIVYQIPTRQVISLLITSEAVAQPSGEEIVFSKGIKFHHDSIDELKVITWSHQGLTYALVSDLETPAQQSCMVCHRDDRQKKPA